MEKVNEKQKEFHDNVIEILTKATLERNESMSIKVFGKVSHRTKARTQQRKQMALKTKGLNKMLINMNYKHARVYSDALAFHLMLVCIVISLS